jgi:hypothetical protein
MTDPPEEPSSNVPAPQPRSRWLALCALVTGVETILLGLAILGTGLGFANATAAGTGAAAMVVGLWTLLAARGVARRRPVTYVGLGLAWLWLVGRIAVDFSATAASGIVMLLLIPTVGVPLGLTWFVLVAAGGLAGLIRLGAMLRRGRSDPGSAATPRPLYASVSVAVRLVVLAGITLVVPHLVWNAREKTIEQLAQQYAHASDPAMKPPKFGACSMVFLGYELTQHGQQWGRTGDARQAGYEATMRDAEADLASIAKAGARFVRVGASGDQLLEDKPDQEAIDDRYIASVRRTGIPLVLVDTQHPQAARNRKLDWAEFCRFQRDRIGYYQRRYHPDVYFVVCEPLSYHGFVLRSDAAFSAEAWASQLSEMCRLVKSIDPSTRTGICLLVGDDHKPEWDVWTRMRNLGELDILSVEIYQPQEFRQTQERLAEYGHPRKSNKIFWIAETYNGWALCGDRRWEQDAAWLSVAADFARVVDAEAVLVWTFGAFVPGGNFLDFGNGKLAERWGEGQSLSPVGRAFARLRRQE